MIGASVVPPPTAELGVYVVATLSLAVCVTMCRQRIFVRGVTFSAELRLIRFVASQLVTQA